MKKILVYEGDSKYNVLNNFAHCLSAELNILHPTICIDTRCDNIDEILYKEINNGIKLTIGFNSMGSRYLYSDLKIPHIAFLVDHPMHVYKSLDIECNNLYIGCTDKERVNFLIDKLNLRNVFLINHAVDRNIEANIYGNKIFDIVMLGGIRNPEKIRLQLKEKYNFNKEILEVIDYVTEIALNNAVFSLEDLIDSVMQNFNIDFEDNKFLDLYDNIFRDIEIYLRNVSRKKTIEYFKNYKIDIFGDIERGTFGDEENLIIHRQVDNKEGIEILKQSKISLNSTKSIINGSHERVLLGGACGAVNLTNKTRYFEELFNDNAIYYSDLTRNEALEHVGQVINDDKERIRMCLGANDIVMKNHTWKNRAEQIMNMID